jgi:hypothetical protein
MTNQAIFRKAIKGKNLMTPDVIRYINTDKYIVELSQGTGFGGEDIFGVTVLNKRTNGAELELDQMFYSREFAEAYIADLR